MEFNLTTLIMPIGLLALIVFNFFSEKKRKQEEQKRKQKLEEMEIGSTVIFHGSLVGVLVGIEEYASQKIFVIKSGSVSYNILPSGINSILSNEVNVSTSTEEKVS